MIKEKTLLPLNLKEKKLSIHCTELDRYLRDLLIPEFMNDYGPNGLQIEGKEEISKIAFAVTASADTINKAVEMKADALIVHHGLFWNFHGVRTITGPFGRRVIPLIKNGINLYGYHLPLDGHADIGNARVIADKLEMTDLEPFGEYKRTVTGIRGKLKNKMTAPDLQKKLESVLNHSVTISTPDEKELISRVGIITGGANSNWLDAYNKRLDAYITGEMSEHDWHESKEYGIHMFAGGHYATEQFGIQALMEKVKAKFKIDCEFIPSENPV